MNRLCTGQHQKLPPLPPDRNPRRRYPRNGPLACGAIAHLFTVAISLAVILLTGCGESPIREAPRIEEICEAPSGSQPRRATDFIDTPQPTRRATPKIIGGSTCDPFANRVALVELYDEEDNVVRCSALVIAPAKLVTAAHCFDEFVFRATVVLGSERREVSGVTNHPRAHPVGDRFSYDVSVATLERPFEQAIPPATLATTVTPGDTLYVFGYGRTSVSEDGPLTDPTLYGGTTTVTALEGDFIASFYDGSGANPCRGDSGGPAFAFDPHTRIFTLVGLVSSGTLESCGPGDETIFSNLLASELRDFLTVTAPEILGPSL